MRIADHFNVDNVQILSGYLVIILVGVFASMVEGVRWPYVATLSLGLLFCFILFVHGTNRGMPWLKGSFWAQTIIIPMLYFLVGDSFIAIMSIIWVIQAAELYGPRIASWQLAAMMSIFC